MSEQKQHTERDWALHPPVPVSHPPIQIPDSLSEMTAPVFQAEELGELDADLTRNGATAGGVPIGERLIMAGRLLDENERPVPNALIEIWQANSAGRYSHEGDQHDAPIDPNFYGTGRCLTDANGAYRFITIRPASYPLPTGDRWRPSHIHFSVMGPTLGTRLVTQNYFAGDPFLAIDPLYNAIPDAAAKERLIAKYSAELTEHGFAIGYEFDIVLRGHNATPMQG